jgi:vacuolar-type H+-ATPase subunit I/STV1
MIVSSFLDSFNQFISRLFARQWAAWEILTIAIIALAVLLWIINRLRSRKVQRVFESQLLGSSPVIGTNLGVHKRSRHVTEDLKKGRLVSIHKHRKQQHVQTKDPSEKLHEEIKQLQYEIIKHKQTESRLEQQVAELTSVNEELKRELAESEQTMLQSQRQIAKEPAAEEAVKKKPARRGKTYEQRHRVVDGVKQKRCRKCKKWKDESEFHKNSSSRDGLAGSCKTCKTNSTREYRRRRKAAKG